MNNHSLSATERFFLDQLWAGLYGGPEVLSQLHIIGCPAALPSAFPVAEFATATVGAASAALAEFATVRFGRKHYAYVERSHAAAAFRPFRYLKPLDAGVTLPSVWDAIAGDYAAGDGFIRLHTNYPQHLRAALRVLQVSANREAVARAVSGWDPTALEQAVVQEGGCAAAMLSEAQWRGHAHGQHVRARPLVDWMLTGSKSHQRRTEPTADVLGGLRVLDLTRVIAGPVCTFVLAAHGAEVLRVDPPEFDEGLPLIAETTLGKRCARLNLRVSVDRERFDALLESADVCVHGYRPGALERLGYGDQALRERYPHLIIASLSAYGVDGPWAERRGFDSLVQMSSGIAATGMRRKGAGKPVPLPAQALDHATGYLLAAAVLRALTERAKGAGPSTARTSLARVAQLLLDAGSTGDIDENDALADAAAPHLVHRNGGPLGRFVQVACPVVLGGQQPCRVLPARPLGHDEAIFIGERPQRAC